MAANNPALHTYDEISKALGISRVRVRQIEKRALQKLRDGLLKRGVQNSRGEDLRDSAR
jgi:DNA-directed RNA polymerase sigma subunit (sigma70/sigma32)